MLLFKTIIEIPHQILVFVIYRINNGEIKFAFFFQSIYNDNSYDKTFVLYYIVDELFVDYLHC